MGLFLLGVVLWFLCSISICCCRCYSSSLRIKSMMAAIVHNGSRVCVREESENDENRVDGRLKSNQINADAVFPLTRRRLLWTLLWFWNQECTRLYNVLESGIFLVSRFPNTNIQSTKSSRPLLGMRHLKEKKNWTTGFTFFLSANKTELRLSFSFSHAFWLYNKKMLLVVMLSYYCFYYCCRWIRELCQPKTEVGCQLCCQMLLLWLLAHLPFVGLLLS